MMHRYQNLNANGNGTMTFSGEQIIASGLEDPRSVFGADLDSDGDIDVLYASFGSGTIAWLENDGNGTFTPRPTNISNVCPGAWQVFAKDLDLDGDIDVLAACNEDTPVISSGKIVWYRNLDALGNFGSERVLNFFANSPTSVFASDLDSDGDIDVLYASYSSNEIGWMENLDGFGTFDPAIIISGSVGRPTSVYAADLNNDGDVDVLYAAEVDGLIAWFPNLGNGTFGMRRNITSASASGGGAARSVFVSDLNGDGYMDVISAFDNKIVW